MEDKIEVEVMCPSCAEMFDTVVSVADYTERIAKLEEQLAAAEREAWNAAIDCVAAVIENVPYDNQNAVAIAKQSAEVARTFKK